MKDRYIGKVQLDRSRALADERWQPRSVKPTGRLSYHEFYTQYTHLGRTDGVVGELFRVSLKQSDLGRIGMSSCFLKLNVNCLSS